MYFLFKVVIFIIATLVHQMVILVCPSGNLKIFFLQNPPKISQNDPTFRKFEANLLYLLQMIQSPHSPSFHRSPLKHAETLLGCQMGGLDHEGGEDDALCKAPSRWKKKRENPWKVANPSKSLATIFYTPTKFTHSASG